MKSNKGFTLVELLAVIILLGIIAMVAVPAVNDTIEASREKAHDEQVERIIKTAKRWAVDNSDELPATNGKVTIDLYTLIDDGYLEDGDIIDPADDESFIEKGYCIAIILTTKTEDDNTTYNYEYELTTSCRN